MIKTPIYYINLDKSSKRNIHMKKELDKYSLYYKRIRGINGKKEILNLREGSIDNINYYIPPEQEIKKCKSIMGCLLSHIKTIEQIIKDDHDIALILEDDISFKYINKWDNTIDNIIKNAPKEWNILKLFTNNPRLVTKLINNFNKNVRYFTGQRLFGNYSTAFYVINKNGLNALKNKYFKNNKWVFRCEYIVADMVLFNIPNVYNYSIPMFVPLSYKSARWRSSGVE